jgi:hypothetical protein
LGEVLKIPHLKNCPCYEKDTCASGLYLSFGTISAMENGNEIWNMECEEPVQVRFTYNSSQGISKVKTRFSGRTES